MKHFMIFLTRKRRITVLSFYKKNIFSLSGFGKYTGSPQIVTCLNILSLK